jgi:hypothetical protein
MQWDGTGTQHMHHQPSCKPKAYRWQITRPRQNIYYKTAVLSTWSCGLHRAHTPTPNPSCCPGSVLLLHIHRVESTLRASGITTLWVSHDPEQPSRVGGRAMELPLGTITSLPPPPPQQSPSSPVHRSNGGAQQRPHEEEAHRVEVKVDSR